MRRHVLLSFCLAISLLLAAAGRGQAQSCNFSATDLSFGTVDTLGGTGTDVAGTITVNCSAFLGLLSSISGTVNIGEGHGGADASGRYMVSGTTSTTLRYQLYTDAARSQVLGSDYWSYGGNPIDISAFAVLLIGTGSASVPFYGRVFGSQSSVEPGSYASVFDRDIIDVRVDYRTCNLLLLCTNRTATFSFEVNATVEPECRVIADDLDFGSVGVLSSNIDAASQMEVLCTAGTSFDISLDNGLYGSGPANRIMRSPAGNDVGYGLYRNAGRSLPWGDEAGGQALSGTGSGAAQDIGVYGRVPPQVTPEPGVYSDTIVVTLTY